MEAGKILTKNEAVKLLMESNYKAKLVDGVVLAEGASHNDFEVMLKLLRDSGYRESFGIVKELPKYEDWSIVKRN